MQHQPPGGTAPLERGQLLAHHRHQVEVLRLHRQLAPLDAGEVQQVLDQAGQLGRAAVDPGDHPLPGVVQGLGAAVQQLGVAVDEGQGRAQLVRDGAQELVLQPVELAQGGRLGVPLGQLLGLQLQLPGPAEGDEHGHEGDEEEDDAQHAVRRRCRRWRAGRRWGTGPGPG